MKANEEGKMLATRQILRSQRVVPPPPQLLRRRRALLNPRHFHNTPSPCVRRSWKSLGPLVTERELESMGLPMGFGSGEAHLKETLEKVGGVAAGMAFCKLCEG